MTTATTTRPTNDTCMTVVMMAMVVHTMVRRNPDRAGVRHAYAPVSVPYARLLHVARAALCTDLAAYEAWLGDERTLVRVAHDLAYTAAGVAADSPYLAPGRDREDLYEEMMAVMTAPDLAAAPVPGWLRRKGVDVPVGFARDTGHVPRLHVDGVARIDAINRDELWLALVAARDTNRGGDLFYDMDMAGYAEDVERTLPQLGTPSLVVDDLLAGAAHTLGNEWRDTYAYLRPDVLREVPYAFVAGVVRPDLNRVGGLPYYTSHDKCARQVRTWGSVNTTHIDDVLASYRPVTYLP